jgi:hypothetical protein
MMDLTTSTPAEIDTWYAPIWDRRLRALQTRRHEGWVLAQHKDSTKPADVRKANHAYQAVQKATEIILATDSDADDYDAEWNRRHGWTQAWLVTSSDGHIHSSRHCHTLYWSTTIGLIPQLSGLAQDEIVGEAGEAACTVCYPNAPVEVRARPAKFGPIAQRRAAAEKRQAELAVKRAAAAVKAITERDGSPLLDDLGWEIKTERTAEIAYVRAAAEAVTWTDESAKENYPQRWAEFSAREAAYAERLLDALAAKHDETVEAARERLAGKVAKKIASERRENAKVLAQLAR